MITMNKKWKLSTEKSTHSVGTLNLTIRKLFMDTVSVLNKFIRLTKEKNIEVGINI